VFYILEGTIILRVVSSWGKEGIVAILGTGDFFGEGCLSGQPLRTSTAVAMTECTVVRIERTTATRMVKDVPKVSEMLLNNLLSRNMKMEEDLVDQLFNTSERRLARLLLQLGKVDTENKTEAVIPKINQETLAEIVGTTRSRVSFFMNKFRRLGLIDYLDHTDVLIVRRALLNVVLREGTTHMSNLGASTAEARASVGQLSM
jgi:CRP-like cAMP-binding protein